ncbi:MAG: hypothetical protein CVT90_00720 [Candidatus Altiarchaeales archaeon HGW-Altiarchaeales-3]|nr:MAG: hypothetical protein CVT90_00720 [Candidatus Altiarchaeales archaeon HGW-Altiarchaeales-3]
MAFPLRNFNPVTDVTDFSIKENLTFFNNPELKEKQWEIAKLILKEIRSRLNFLDKVGLNYLTLSRNSCTLSGGEAQRIRIATQIGSTGCNKIQNFHENP